MIIWGRVILVLILWLLMWNILYVKKIVIFMKKKKIYLMGENYVFLIYVQFKLNLNIFINVVVFMIGIILIKWRIQLNVFLKSIYMNYWINLFFFQCICMEKRYIKMMLNMLFFVSKVFFSDLKKIWGMEGDKMLYSMYFMIN